MTRGDDSGWLVPLADLSLILFIVTGATLAGTLGKMPDEAAPEDMAEESLDTALSEDEEEAEDEAAPAVTPAITEDSFGAIAEGMPTAVHMDYAGGPQLSEWLAQYTPGPNEQLTIQGYYTSADRARTARRAEELAQQAIAAGENPRIILQPAQQTQVVAMFAHDRDAQMARSLL